MPKFEARVRARGSDVDPLAGGRPGTGAGRGAGGVGLTGEGAGSSFWTGAGWGLYAGRAKL
jgi:hypothetical protein